MRDEGRAAVSAAHVETRSRDELVSPCRSPAPATLSVSLASWGGQAVHRPLLAP